MHYFIPACNRFKLLIITYERQARVQEFMLDVRPVSARERMPVLKNPKNLPSSVLDMHIYLKDPNGCRKMYQNKNHTHITRTVSTGSAASWWTYMILSRGRSLSFFRGGAPDTRLNPHLKDVIKIGSWNRCLCSLMILRSCWNEDKCRRLLRNS